MTTFCEWLDEERGRSAQIADHFGVTRSAVTQWRSNGIPRRFLVRMHRMTGLPLEVLLERPAEVEKQ